MFSDVYPLCIKHMGECAWQKLAASCEDALLLPERLAQKLHTEKLPAYLPDLARLERACWRVKSRIIAVPENVQQLMLNPSLELLHLSWKLSSALKLKADSSPAKPQAGEEWVLIWRNPQDEVQHKQATQDDLLAIKLVAEGIDVKDAARANQVPVGVIDKAVYQALQKGILLSPATRIRRDPRTYKAEKPPADKFLAAPVFAIQWHITNACDLACKHCYDRSQPSPLQFDAALKVLDDLYDFCKTRSVRGQVTFTGGNPFLYPRFSELYRAAADYGFSLSILGNPTPRKQLEALLSIQNPRFFQVSLEGLGEHNDEIRGAGHYERVMNFLPLLKELGIFASVMLTLTKDNIDQVLPLADELQGVADSFTFNRLSQVGEGAGLELPDKAAYTAFLAAYTKAARQNPLLYYKDNLFNILRHQMNEPLLSGCTGYGCGAAFNFIAILPDGKAHACRKFPSPIGNVISQKIAEVYDSAAANKYRTGCNACRGCVIRHVCGGCMAIAHSFRQDIFTEKDPYCFMNNLSQ